MARFSYLAHAARDSAASWGILASNDHLGPADLRTAHGVLAGELCKHGITLIAKRGRPLEIDATIFVSADWQDPCFLGYAGVLERLRFAVDPYANRFFFGPLP